MAEPPEPGAPKAVRDAKFQEVLAWDTLLQTLGSEEAVRSTVKLIRDDDSSADVVALVDKVT